MRILHLGKFFPPFSGGVENVMFDLMAAQRKAGHDARAIAHHHRPLAGTSRDTISGIPVLRVRTLGSLVYAPVSPSFGFHLRSELRSFVPDVVHVHMPNVSAFWLLLLRHLPRTVLHWHSDVVPSALDRRLALLYQGYRIFERRILARADAVVATSPQYLEHSAPLREFRAKCHVVPLGLDPQRLNAASADPQAVKALKSGAHRLILSAGRFTYYKGFEHLIRAARDLPQDVRVVISGAGPLLEQCRRLAAELGVADRVSLPGMLPDAELHALLAQCDVFCLPSVERTEAFGLVLLEAAALGRPLVTTDVPGSGMSHANIHGETGLVCQPADSKALASALRTLMDDPQQANIFGNNARQRFQALFTMEAVCDAIVQIYENIPSKSHFSETK